MKSRWWVLAPIGAGTFVSALDGSVVNTVLPVIQQAFGVGVPTIEWVVTIYLLVVSSVLLTFGRLGDLRGHKRIYLWGLVVFIAGSAFCGLAPAAGVLIAARAIQGLGAAMLFANAPAILTANFPAEQRGRVLGLAASMTYIGLTVGPSLGGWVATAWSWRILFYVNIPIALVTLALAWEFVPADFPDDHAREGFDVPGAVMFMLGLVALLLALNQAHAWGWTSLPILALLAAAVGCLAAFLVIESRAPAPMLDLGLFGARVFSAATASAVINYICIFSTVFLLPFYLIQGRGLAPAHAGLVMTMQPLVMAITAPLAGMVSDRIGSRGPATLGMALLAAGLLLLSRLGPDDSMASIALALAVTGLGTAVFGSPNNSALMGAAPRQRQGTAAGVLACARNVGMVLGVGLAAAVFTTVAGAAPATQPGPSFFAGIDAAFFATGLVAVAGIFTAAVR